MQGLPITGWMQSGDAYIAVGGEFCHPVCMYPESPKSDADHLSPLDLGNVTSLADAATVTIRNAILEGRIRPGTRLLQTELALELGISRQPIREALQQLEREGLVSMSPRIGAIVRVYHEREIRENYRLRSILESEAARLAALEFNSRDIRALAAIHGEMKSALDAADYLAVNTCNANFHSRIRSAANSPTLCRMIDMLWVGHTVMTPMFIKGRAERSYVEHEAIFQALKNKDSQAAGDAEIRHIEVAFEEFRAAAATHGGTD
jgi:DNA-binding GntR family transcriptional regulator